MSTNEDEALGGVFVCSSILIYFIIIHYWMQVLIWTGIILSISCSSLLFCSAIHREIYLRLKHRKIKNNHVLKIKNNNNHLIALISYKNRRNFFVDFLFPRWSIDTLCFFVSGQELKVIPRKVKFSEFEVPNKKTLDLELEFLNKVQPSIKKLYYEIIPKSLEYKDELKRQKKMKNKALVSDKFSYRVKDCDNNIAKLKEAIKKIEIYRTKFFRVYERFFNSYRIYRRGIIKTLKDL